VDKKILFISEVNYNGIELTRNFKNSRTDVAWELALNADHMSFGGGYGNTYDLIILIIPKKIERLGNFEELKSSFLSMLKANKGKFAVMQEGPYWYFQDYSIEDQIKYYNILLSADFLLCHNDADVRYFAGITGKACYTMQSLMIEDTIKNLPEVERKGVILGGNFVSWYGGFDSYVVAREFETEKIYLPSMGRKQDNEEVVSGLVHSPYMIWTDWIKYLNNFKYGVHMMRIHAAGTFALNCSYLGIPCIGYYGLDTQQILHPSLCVELGDINTARELANKLKEDKKFYEYCSTETKHMYNMFYTEEVFISQFKKILKNEGILDEEI